MSVAPKTPKRCAMRVSSSSMRSGMRTHTAMAMKPTPNTQRNTSGLTTAVIQVPTAPASP